MEYICLLRGINVSGQKLIKMKDLAPVFEQLGYNRVQTYIQSGNVLFSTPEKATDKLKHEIETRIHQTFGFEVPVFLLTPDDIQSILENNPFSEETRQHPEQCYVTLLAGVPQEQYSRSTQSLSGGTDLFHIAGNVVYLFCLGGYGKSKLSNNFFEQKLKTGATTRNWKTMVTLAERVNQRID